MISYRIIDRDEFLEGLFHGSVWDNFFVVRAEISSYVRAEITPAAPCKWGRLKKDLQGFLEPEENELKFQIELRPDWDLKENALFQGVEQVFFHLRYAGGELHAVTGIAYETFVPGRTAEREWDRLAGLFLKKNRIAFEG